MGDEDIGLADVGDACVVRFGAEQVDVPTAPQQQYDVFLSQRFARVSYGLLAFRMVCSRFARANVKPNN